MDSLSNYLDKRSNKPQTSGYNITAGVVDSVNEDNTKASVKLVECGGMTVTLLNKTHERLDVDDSVWIWYRTNIAGGFIAIKNGEAESHVESDDVDKIVAMQLADYNALAVKDSKTLYCIIKEG